MENLHQPRQGNKGNRKNIARQFLHRTEKKGGNEKLNKWVIPRYHAHTPEDERLSAQLDALEML